MRMGCQEGSACLQPGSARSAGHRSLMLDCPQVVKKTINTQDRIPWETAAIVGARSD